MDASLAKLNNLALTYADIQVSPHELVRLNAQPMTLFSDNLLKTQPTVAGYRVLLTGYAAHIQDKEQRMAEYRNLILLLNSLRSLPRSASGFSLKGSVDTYSQSNAFYRVDYRIASGQVVVFNIQPVTRLQRLRDAQERPALYVIKKNGDGTWKLGKKVNHVGTRYAAVNGQSNNLVKATWLMGSHLDYEFGKTAQEYTLFHNPSVGGPGDTWESVRDKLGFTTDVTKHFSKVLSETQILDNETVWLAHSQGGVIFAEGVRYLLNGNSSWAFNKLRLNGARHPDKGKILDKQSVALHGNANNSLRCRPLFERAGVEVVATRAHDYDFVANILGINTLNPRKLLGSIIYSNHVLNGSVAQSPHTLAQDMPAWEKNMQEGPGKGRGVIQSAFNQTGKTMKAIANYLP